MSGDWLPDRDGPPPSTSSRQWVVRSTTTPGAIHFKAIGFEVTDNGVYFETDPTSDEPQIFFSHPVSVMPEFL